ncbi:MAG: replication initiation protein [Oribacterium sp.]|nr:replication initiation protein [Oribacterium sp.]
MKKGTKKVTFPIIASPNKDLVVAYEFLKWARQTNMSVHEMRIIIRLIERCNEEITGYIWKDYVGSNKPKFEHNLFDVTVTMYAQDIFINSDLKHKEIIQVLDNLSNRSISHDSPEEWWKVSFCSNPIYKKGTGIIKFAVGNKLWDMFTAFARGVHEFELNKCLALPTPTAMIFYLMVSKQSKPLVYSIDLLKSMLGIAPDAYKDKDGTDRIDNFEKAVLKPVQEALDNSCPYTFDWDKIRVNPRNPRSKVTGFKIIPIYQPKFRDEHLAKMEALNKLQLKFWQPAVMNCLLNDFGIPKESLQMPKNRETIADAIKYIPNFADWLRNDLLPRADENKGIGWIIQAIKNETEDCKKQQEVKKNENLEEMTADNALQILEESGHHNIKKFIEMNAKQDKRSSTKDALSLGDLFK